MRYLLCKDSYSRDKYYELKEGQEAHITHLMQTHKLPKTFKLNGDTVIANEIIGFTDDKIDRKELGLRSMADLRSWAEQQPWYKKKAKPEPSYQAPSVNAELVS